MRIGLNHGQLVQHNRLGRRMHDNRRHTFLHQTSKLLDAKR